MVKGQLSAASRPQTAGKKLPKKITETYLHNSGLYYLQRFAASSGHFREVMRRKIDRSCLYHLDQNKEECYALLDTLIEKFENSGLLDDKIYTRNTVSSLRNRGLSERAIVMKLQNRGISIEQIKEALSTFCTDHQISNVESEMTAALKLARKKRIGPYAAGKEFDRNKALAAFARAGFSFNVARQVLGMDEELALEITDST